MMTRWLSRRHPRYIRSLVYMLQASEYDLKDFLKWHERVTDFRKVELRKHISYTPKAVMLLAFSWAAVLGLLVAAFAASTLQYPVGVIVAGGIIVELPLLVLLLLLAVLMMVQILQKPIEWILVSRAQRALAKHSAVKIAIAGSYGKTSMREILKSVIGTGKRVAAATGSINTPLGIAGFVRTLQGDEEVLIFELGEYYPGDIKRLCQMINPSIGVITGVNEAHFEKFGSVKAAAATIFELAEHLGDAPLYLNGENEVSRQRARKGDIVYSREQVGRWLISDAATSLEGTVFTMRAGDEEIRARSKLLGLHMVGPVAAAAVVAKSIGLTAGQIEQGIGETRPFVHRLEPRRDVSGVITLDDSYNGNPDGVRAIIEFLKQIQARRWYVTPGLVEVGERSEAVHREIGELLAQARIEKVVLIRNSVTPYIEAGLQNSGYRGDIVWYENALEAYAALPHLTLPGDVVVLQNDWPDQYA